MCDRGKCACCLSRSLYSLGPLYLSLPHSFCFSVIFLCGLSHSSCDGVLSCYVCYVCKWRTWQRMFGVVFPWYFQAEPTKCGGNTPPLAYRFSKKTFFKLVPPWPTGPTAVSMTMVDSFTPFILLVIFIDTVMISSE